MKTRKKNILKAMHLVISGLGIDRMSKDEQVIICIQVWRILQKSNICGIFQISKKVWVDNTGTYYINE